MKVGISSLSMVTVQLQRGGRNQTHRKLNWNFMPRVSQLHLGFPVKFLYLLRQIERTLQWLQQLLSPFQYLQIPDPSFTAPLGAVRRRLWYNEIIAYTTHRFVLEGWSEELVDP